VASYRLTFGASLIGALINLVFGVLVAWVLVRYSFPGKRLFDSLVDLPFALPTAVAGIALTTIYAPNGWLGRPLASIGIKSAYSPLGVAIALTFIGLPFVVREWQPVPRRHGQELRRKPRPAWGPAAWRRRPFPRWCCHTPARWPPLALPCVSQRTGNTAPVVFISGNMPCN
jgi:sulfate transport system permease protein